MGDHNYMTNVCQPCPRRRPWRLIGGTRWCAGRDAGAARMGNSGFVKICARTRVCRRHAVCARTPDRRRAHFETSAPHQRTYRVWSCILPCFDCDYVKRAARMEALTSTVPSNGTTLTGSKEVLCLFLTTAPFCSIGSDIPLSFFLLTLCLPMVSRVDPHPIFRNSSRWLNSASYIKCSPIRRRHCLLVLFQ